MLSLQIFNAPNGTLLADYTSRIHPGTGGGGLSFSTNEHGFAALNAPLVPMTLAEAFEVYDWPGTPHVVVSDFASGVAWEGRLEDIAIVPGGVALTALGYQRALSDLLYTALWSYTGSAGWEEVTGDQLANRDPEMYEIDNNNRLYIAPRKGEVFPISGGGYGQMTYTMPHLGGRNIAKFEASYAVNLPANWIVRVYTCDYDYNNAVLEATVTATGSAQSGTWNLTTGARQRVYIVVNNNTGATSTITTETGEKYVKVTGIRIKSTTSATVTASAIAAALADYVNTVNADQLQDLTTLISATTTDLQNEIYEDETPADILTRLALLHGYEWAVWENRYLTFQERGSGGRHWYVDAMGGLELQRSLANIYNAAKAVYKGLDGSVLRTATATNAASIARYGVTRRGNVDVDTTSSSEAETHRDVYLADNADNQGRVEVGFNRLYDAAGSLFPLWSVRSGDTITIRNLPPTLSASVDRIRTFVVSETEYDAASDTVSVSPYMPPPTLDRLVARRAAGIK